jgi:hypothetical protein
MTRMNSCSVTWLGQTDRYPVRKDLTTVRPKASGGGSDPMSKRAPLTGDVQDGIGVSGLAL